MKYFLCVLVALTWLASPARAYIDVTPTLGRLLKDSSTVVLLRVEQVSREKRIIIYRKVADLKGHHPTEQVKHQITDGFHPREPASILDWAEPGQLAISFHNGVVAETCIGKYWYESAAGAGPWWTMTYGQAALSFAYSGSVQKLRQHVRAMLEGQEVVITALKYGADDEHWRECKRTVVLRDMPRGKEFPLCRFKASLHMPATIYAMAKDRKVIVQPGAGGPEDVPALLVAVQDRDWRVRAEAAEDLGLIGATASAAIPLLVETLQDPEVKVRILAAEALARVDAENQQAVPILVAALKEPAADIRKAATEALGNLGTTAGTAFPALVAVLSDMDPRVRRGAVAALGRISSPSEAAISALSVALKDPEPIVRGAAMNALGWFGTKARAAAPLLVLALEDADDTLRWTAASALVRVDRTAARAATPIFIQALRGTDSRVRWHALVQLMKLDRETNRTVPVSLLIQALKDPDTGVRGMAAWVLGEIGPKAEDAAPVLTEMLSNRDGWVRSMAAPSLVKILGRKATAAVPDLIEGLQDEDEETRRDSLVALRMLGPAAKEAAPEIVQTLRGNNGSLRLLAAETLWRVNYDVETLVPILITWLEDGDKDLRAGAARLLGRIGPDSPATTAALVSRLNDEDGEVRGTVAEALEKIDPDAAARVSVRNKSARAGWDWKLAVWLLLIAVVCLPLLARRFLVKGAKG